MAVNSYPRQDKLKEFVFTDPVAFRYLEEDPITVVLERHGIIEGYQLYLVEQWACSRIHPTFVINTYTGDLDCRAVVGVLGIPADEDSWSPRLRLYFDAISEFYARLQETPLGLLMVTNLNSFPSTLTIIPVPNGDVKIHRYSFIVNENLKRLGCSGRSGMSLTAPAGATQAKFLQLYKTSQRIPLSDAIIELIKLCQIALVVFGKLEQEYADGFLCDITQIAIKDWWTEIGSEHYNTEPSDGILGPTTVAGLLGMLIGGRNRLSYYGASVGKDAFDLCHFERGIENFQKTQKLRRTRRLDRHTLDRLHKVTAKAAAGEGWAVPKAVKSTVAELSSKGGEMVLGIVGRDKAGIGDIETLNIDHFISLANNERTKWLWHGKPRRNGLNENQSFPCAWDDPTTLIWSHCRPETGPIEDELESRSKDERSPVTTHSRNLPGSTNYVSDGPSDRDHLHRAVLKSVSDKVNDAKNGFGRIKGAVGLRGNASKQTKDESIVCNNYNLPSSLVSSFPYSSSPLIGSKIYTWKDTQNEFQNDTSKLKESPSISVAPAEEPHTLSIHGQNLTNMQDLVPQKSTISRKNNAWSTERKKIYPTLSLNDNSLRRPREEAEFEQPNIETKSESNNCKILQRRKSIAGGIDTLKIFRNENSWPRHMSFSEAEDALFYWKPISSLNDEESSIGWPRDSNNYMDEEHMRRLLEMLVRIQDDIEPWVEKKLLGVIKIDEQLLQDQENFRVIYGQILDQYRMIKLRSKELLVSEHSYVLGDIKEIETLRAKLEYEIDALDSKVNDVEDGVVQLERQVDELERRAIKLDVQLKAENWTRWIVGILASLKAGSSLFVPV